MMQKNEGKAFFLALVFFALFFALFTNGLFYQSNDNQEHLFMAKDPSYNKEYAPLFRNVAQFFTINPSYWYAFVLFLFAFLTPLTIFFISKEWISVPLYFFSTNYFYQIVSAGLYAQGLVILLVLSIFAVKNNYVRVGLLVLCFLAHSMGVWLGLITFILVLAEENNYFSKAWFFLKHKKFVFACSPLFGNNSPEVLSQEIGVIEGKAWSFSFGEFISFFTKTCPLPFLFIAFCEWVRDERLSWFFLW